MWVVWVLWVGFTHFIRNVTAIFSRVAAGNMGIMRQKPSLVGAI